MTNHYLHSAQPDEVQPLKTGQSHVASEGRSVSQVSHGVEPRGVHDQVFAKLIKTDQCHRCQKETVVREGWDPDAVVAGAGGPGAVPSCRPKYSVVHRLSSDLTTNPLCSH
jgi:hypothetical protein